jgi:hypothetical protein
MKTIALLLVLPMLALAQVTPSAPAGFERSGALSATAILRAEVLRGPYHRVREAVPTSGGAPSRRAAG